MRRCATETVSSSLAEHAEPRVDVGHAVEFDHGKAGDLAAVALGKREIEQVEQLGVTGQAGELVLVDGAAGGLFAVGEFAPRPAQLPQRDAGEGRRGTAP